MAGIIEKMMVNQVEPILHDFYLRTTTGIATYVAEPFTILATIVIIIAGLGFLSGEIEGSIKKFIVACLTVGGVALFSLGFVNYNMNLGFYLTSLPDHMMGLTSGFFAGGADLDTPATAAKAIDTTITSLDDAVNRMFDHGSYRNWPPFIYGLVLWFIGIVLVVVMVVALLMVKVGITVVAALGPLFILGLLFKSTREYFTKWITFVSQFIVAGALLGLYLGFSYLLLDTQYTELEDADGFDDLVSAITPLVYLLPVIGALFITTTSYASSLSGGVAIGVGNALQKITKTGMNATRSVARGAGNRATRGYRERREADRSIRMAGARGKARVRSNAKKNKDVSTGAGKK